MTPRRMRSMQHGRESRLHDVAAGMTTTPRLAGGGGDVVDDGEEVARDEGVGERAQERGEGAIVARRVTRTPRRAPCSARRAIGTVRTFERSASRSVTGGRWGAGRLPAARCCRRAAACDVLIVRRYRFSERRSGIGVFTFICTRKCRSSSESHMSASPPSAKTPPDLMIGWMTTVANVPAFTVIVSRRSTFTITGFFVGDEVALEAVRLSDLERDGAHEVEERAVVERIRHARLLGPAPACWNIARSG